MTAGDERNAVILRRTLCAISWLYMLWSGLLAAMTWSRRGEALVDPRLILMHAALLGLAGTLLWKPRREGVLFTGLACAGSLAFVALDFSRHHPGAALIDGAYPLLAAALLYKSRPQA